MLGHQSFCTPRAVITSNQKKCIGLANITLYCNRSLIKTVIFDITATLENENKTIFLLTQ